MNNYEKLKNRVKHANNDRQHDRMVEDKKKSLQRALLYSYQGTWIKKDEPDAEWCRALVNPDKIKFDYDEKIISTPFENGFQPGDSFEFPKNSNVHWLILKQELTEVAYFRGNARRCQELIVDDPDTGEKITLYAVVRGPVETKINTIQKAGIVADVPNLTLHVYVARTEKNKKIFQRYNRFFFEGVYWKVTAPDWISTPNILEFTAEEDYKCDSDKPIKREPESESLIIGETFTKPLMTYSYSVADNISGSWSVALANLKNKDIDDVLEWKVASDNTLSVKWTLTTSGAYIISYGDIEKHIVVESLF